MNERLEVKLSNQNFYHKMEKVFGLSMQQQKELPKAQATGNEDVGKAVIHGLENQITQRNNEILCNLIKSNAIDSSITTTLANLMNSFKKSEFSLTHNNCIRFSTNKSNPQNIPIKGSL